MINGKGIVNRIIAIFICCSAQAQQHIDSVAYPSETREGAGQAESFDELSARYLALDKNDSALRFGRQAYVAAWRGGDSLMMVRTGRHVATAFRRLGELDSALVIYKTILPISSRSRDHT